MVESYESRIGNIICFREITRSHFFRLQMIHCFIAQLIKKTRQFIRNKTGQPWFTTPGNKIGTGFLHPDESVRS